MDRWMDGWMDGIGWGGVGMDGWMESVPKLCSVCPEPADNFNKLQLFTHSKEEPITFIQ